MKQICVQENGSIITSDDHGNLNLGFNGQAERLSINLKDRFAEQKTAAAVINIQEIASELALVVLREGDHRHSAILNISNGAILHHWPISVFTFAHPAILSEEDGEGKLTVQICYLSHPSAGRVMLKKFLAEPGDENSQPSCKSRRSLFQRDGEFKRKRSWRLKIQDEEREWLWKGHDNVMSIKPWKGKSFLILSESKLVKFDLNELVTLSEFDTITSTPLSLSLSPLGEIHVLFSDGRVLRGDGATMNEAIHLLERVNFINPPATMPNRYDHLDEESVVWDFQGKGLFLCDANTLEVISYIPLPNIQCWGINRSGRIAVACRDGIMHIFDKWPGRRRQIG